MERSWNNTGRGNRSFRRKICHGAMEQQYDSVAGKTKFRRKFFTVPWSNNMTVPSENRSFQRNICHGATAHHNPDVERNATGPKAPRLEAEGQRPHLWRGD
jgi:hypothetical protein